MNTSIFSRYTFYLAAIIALSITFSSCEKEDEKPETTCRVRKLTYTPGHNIFYEYNAEGLLKKDLHYRSDSSLSLRHEYEYNTQQIAKDNMYIYFLLKTEPTVFTDVYEYDAQGRLSKTISYLPDGQVGITYEHMYAGNTQTTKSFDSFGRLSNQTIIEYQDGYVVKETRTIYKSNFEFITTYTYYTDKVDKAGAQNPRDPSAKGKYLLQQSKTLYKRPTVDSTVTNDYSYEFNEKGYLTKAVNQFSYGYTHTSLYEYECK